MLSTLSRSGDVVKMPFVYLFPALITLVAPASLSGRLMATLTAGSVPGVSEELGVYEDLGSPEAPIVFRDRSGTVRFLVPKNKAELQVSPDPGRNWAADSGVGLAAVLNEEVR
jgi:hypothetical protein